MKKEGDGKSIFRYVLSRKMLFVPLLGRIDILWMAILLCRLP